MLTDLSINLQRITEEIVNFIRTTVPKTGFSRLIVGLSGGIDSAVSSALAVKAVSTENIYVGLFPYGKLNEEGMEGAKLTINKLGIPIVNVCLIDIKPLVDKLYSSSERSESRSFSRSSSRQALYQNGTGQARTINSKADLRTDNLRKGNITVRTRMILLYDLAKKYQALVLGTENKTEYLLGYFTRFGDEASDLAPIRGLYKTQIKELAKYLGIPQKIINKAPTAGMWIGQTDEGELGFTYEEADQILHLYIDQKKSEEEIIKSGLKRETVEKVIKRMRENEFKHKTPYCLAYSF